jgi:hypothetical protein
VAAAALFFTEGKEKRGREREKNASLFFLQPAKEIG